MPGAYFYGRDSKVINNRHYFFNRSADDCGSPGGHGDFGFKEGD